MTIEGGSSRGSEPPVAVIDLSVDEPGIRDGGSIVLEEKPDKLVFSPSTGELSYYQLYGGGKPNPEIE